VVLADGIYEKADYLDSDFRCQGISGRADGHLIKTAISQIQSCEHHPNNVDSPALGR
jgi:hypothetical protein